jgi:hypothetical protein
MKIMLLVSRFSLSYLAMSVNIQFAKLVIGQIPRAIFEEYGVI